MPVAQFGGQRGWGYDGVLLYAPHRAYGGPDGLKALVDAAHGRGLMVLLDVVYNHFGPDGNYLPLYAEGFFDAARERSEEHTSELQSLMRISYAVFCLKKKNSSKHRKTR